MTISRRDLLQTIGFGAGAFTAGKFAPSLRAQDTPLNRLSKSRRDLTIKEFRVTPIALPDPPLLAASGCHGPYYLRAIVEIVTTDGIIGVGETGGSEGPVTELKHAASHIVGPTALAYRTFPDPPAKLSARAYGAVEVACL